MKWFIHRYFLHSAENFPSLGFRFENCKRIIKKLKLIKEFDPHIIRFVSKKIMQEEFYNPYRLFRIPELPEKPE